MKEKFGKSVTPFVYPIREGDEFKGFVDIVDMTARRYEGQDRVDIPVPDGMAEIVAPLREMIMRLLPKPMRHLWLSISTVKNLLLTKLSKL